MPKMMLKMTLDLYGHKLDMIFPHHEEIKHRKRISITEPNGLYMIVDIPSGCHDNLHKKENIKQLPIVILSKMLVGDDWPNCIIECWIDDLF